MTLSMATKDESVNVLEVVGDDEQWPEDVPRESVPAAPVSVGERVARAEEAKERISLAEEARVRGIEVNAARLEALREAQAREIQTLRDMVTRLAVGAAPILDSPSPPPPTTNAPAESDTPVGSPVRIAGASRADFRVNLTVAAAEADACAAAGGLLDATNGVMYAPPRVDLRPLSRWLPFDLAAVHADA